MEDKLQRDGEQEATNNKDYSYAIVWVCQETGKISLIRGLSKEAAQADVNASTNSSMRVLRAKNDKILRVAQDTHVTLGVED